MPIQVGQKLPSLRIKVAAAQGGGDVLSTDELFGRKNVVIFGVPGAFTPVCSNQHVPGFLAQEQALHAAGIDLIACLSSNDAWVMGAWGRSLSAFPALTMLADGNGEFTEALGLGVDLRQGFLGVRTQRFVLVAKNGTVQHLGIEEPGKLEVSTAEAVLAALGQLPAD